MDVYVPKGMDVRFKYSPWNKVSKKPLNSIERIICIVFLVGEKTSGASSIFSGKGFSTSTQSMA